MKRSFIVIGVIVVLIIVLGAGAFTAVRLLAESEQPEAVGAGVQVYEDVFDDGSGPVTIKTIVEPAAELPQVPAATAGVLTRREDNSLFVGTGSTSVSVNVVNGETTVSTDHSGPEIEVFISRDTRVYKDVTEIDLTATESVERRVQQIVREVPLPDDLQNGANIAVWGEKRGDRVVANVIVFGETE